jgi:hypothetical protein
LLKAMLKLLNDWSDRTVRLTIVDGAIKVVHRLFGLIQQAGNRTHRFLHVERALALHHVAVLPKPALHGLVEGVTAMYWSPRKPRASTWKTALVRILIFREDADVTATERPSGINSTPVALPMGTPDIITSAVGLRPAALGSTMRKV